MGLGRKIVGSIGHSANGLVPTANKTHRNPEYLSTITRPALRTNKRPSNPSHGVPRWTGDVTQAKAQPPAGAPVVSGAVSVPR